VGTKAVILDVEPDEPHIAAGKQIDRAVREALESIPLPFGLRPL
jgi:hypothetical protein